MRRSADTSGPDAWFTKPELAKSLAERAHSVVSQLGLVNPQWIEPSAGAGAFLPFLPADRWAYDISPCADGIERLDFLKWTPPPCDRPIVALGNPPFGRKGSAAKEFIYALEPVADVVAFILPLSFARTERMRSLFRVYYEQLPPDSFVFPDGKKSRQIHTCFCIYSKREMPEDDEVELAKPPKPAAVMGRKPEDYVDVRRVDYSYSDYDKRRYTEGAHYALLLNIQEGSYKAGERHRLVNIPEMNLKSQCYNVVCVQRNSPFTHKALNRIKWDNYAKTTSGGHRCLVKEDIMRAVGDVLNSPTCGLDFTVHVILKNATKPWVRRVLVEHSNFFVERSSFSGKLMTLRAGEAMPETKEWWACKVPDGLVERLVAFNWSEMLANSSSPSLNLDKPSVERVIRGMLDKPAASDVIAVKKWVKGQSSDDMLKGAAFVINRTTGKNRLEPHRVSAYPCPLTYGEYFLIEIVKEKELVTSLLPRIDFHDYKMESSGQQCNLRTGDIYKALDDEIHRR